MSCELVKTHVEICKDCGKEHVLGENEGLATCDCQC